MYKIIISQLVLHFLFFQDLVKGEVSCVCPRTHLQEGYCYSKYVFKASYIKTTSNTYDDMEKVLFRILKIFKGTQFESKYKDADSDSVYITMPKICSIRSPSLRDEYIVFVIIRNGRLYSNFCTGTREWYKVSDTNKLGLARYYEIGCDCIKSGNVRRKRNVCHYQYSYFKEIWGRCSWVQTDEFVKCLDVIELRDYC